MLHYSTILRQLQVGCLLPSSLSLIVSMQMFLSLEYLASRMTCTLGHLLSDDAKVLQMTEIANNESIESQRVTIYAIIIGLYK